MGADVDPGAASSPRVILEFGQGSSPARGPLVFLGRTRAFLDLPK